MKKLFVLILILFLPNFKPQNLKNFTIPKGYKKIIELKGDIDKDGIDEYVLVFKTNQKIKSDFQNGYKREFFILKKVNNQLKISNHNKTILFADETGFYPEYNSLPEFKIENGILEITQIFNTNSRYTQTYIDKFRFQNNDFYLIGSVNEFDDTCEFNILNEINFSTGKVIIDEQYHSCFDDGKAPAKDYYKELSAKFKPIKMNGFIAGEKTVQIPNTNKYFNY